MPKIIKPKTDERLKAETEKWLARLEERVKSVKPVEDRLERAVLKNSMDNVNAYIKDCRHFLAGGDLVNAFEAIIYAWGIFETLERMKLLKDKR